jgi:hypothetical protein
VAANEIFVGDVGTELRFDIGVESADVQVAKIKVVKPDKSTVEWDAVVGPGDTEVSYTIQEGDLDISGTWKLQVYVELPGWKGHGSIVSMKVKETL